MNQVTLVGYIGSDLTTKTFDNEKKLTTFSLGCKARGKEKTIWYRISLWNGNFESIYPYLKKGGQIAISGELQKPRVFNDKEGKPTTLLEVVPYSINLLKSSSEEGSVTKPVQESPSKSDLGKHFPPSVFDDTNLLF